MEVPGLGLIRLLLTLTVLVDHSAPLFGRGFLGGELAVQCFFVLSGFYMTMILHGTYEGRTWDFYRNRFLRLFPMYWMILLVTVLLSMFLWWHSDGQRAGLLAAWHDRSPIGFPAWCLVGFSLVFLLLQDWLFFLGADPSDGSLVAVADCRTHPITLHRFLVVGPAWSLGLEMAFYLLVPWIVRFRARTTALLLLAAFALKLWLGHRGMDYDPWSYRFFPTVFGYFLCGVLAWKLGQRMRLDALPAWSKALPWFGLLGAGIFWRPGPAWASALYVAGLALAAPLVFDLTRNWRWDRRIGDLSFPLYLCHPLVFAMTPKLWLPLRFLAAIAVAAGLHGTIGAVIEKRRAGVRASGV